MAKSDDSNPRSKYIRRPWNSLPTPFALRRRDGDSEGGDSIAARSCLRAASPPRWARLPPAGAAGGADVEGRAAGLQRSSSYPHSIWDSYEDGGTGIRGTWNEANFHYSHNKFHPLGSLLIKVGTTTARNFNSCPRCGEALLWNGRGMACIACSFFSAQAPPPSERRLPLPKKNRPEEKR